MTKNIFMFLSLNSKFLNFLFLTLNRKYIIYLLKNNLINNEKGTEQMIKILLDSNNTEKIQGTARAYDIEMISI
ncbi:hypothetical protein BpHYR1_025584 [Brachionus plicatilis]|uniref:Uncharacterized protein n=1 Tax=Brachionus plicatilis TaxID=10195 RepID=A0A3M7S4L2_BRAPC|nr:hypothetical protein BpHYR1_025584 [Brachionus plicatilis]